MSARDTGRVWLTRDCSDPRGTWTTIQHQPRGRTARAIADVAMTVGRAADLAAWVPVIRAPAVFTLSCVQYVLERLAELADR